MRRQRKSKLLVVLAVLAVLQTSIPGRAAEPHLKFLNGLKDRGYYNTALEYLQTLEDDPKTPADIKTIVPYERAQILIRGGSTTSSLQEQRTQLDQAESNLERFVKASPEHPLAGQANSVRADLLLQRGQVEIWDAEAAQSAQQRDLQNRARGYLSQAKAIITKAIEQHEKAAKAFPTFIPETDKAQREQRDAAQGRLLQAQVDAANIAYWTARSYPPGDERKKGLETAAAAYERIVQSNRQWLAGNYALIWQGKCYEELGDVGKALGIYKQILEHDDKSSVMQSLKDTALHFRLVCLNSDQRRDYAVVIDEAESWLRDNPSRALSPSGLGIQWELARALEAQGSDRTRSDTQRRADLNAALERARTISRQNNGEHKGLAVRMVQRMTVALDRKGTMPRDFEGAYAAGSAIAEEAGKKGDAYRTAVAKGDSKGAAEIMRAIKASGDDAAKLFTLALSLRTPRTEPEKSATARLQLAYSYFLQGRYLDCATIADHQMRTYAGESQDVAREAGYLAMLALEAATASGPRGPSFELDWMQSIGQHMIAKWPESDRSQEAKVLLGRAAWSQQKFLDAAKWWTAVPPSASQFATSQISAGQAYWKRYVEASQLPEGERPSSDELNGWKASAIKTLERGISQRQATLSSASPTPDDLVLGKLVLAQMRNLDGQYKGIAGRDGAIELLTRSPHSVVSAVAVRDGESRPTDGGKAKSAKIASLAYQQLLRAYVGVRDTDAARDAMRNLELVAGSENPAALTAIYVDFGRELQRELNQLRAIGQSDRATKTRQAFEEFLNDLAARSEGQSLTSLLWIAETYAGLADDAKNSPEGGQKYTQKSAEVYARILSRADEPGFLPSPSYKTALRLNLAVSQRRQKDFAAAETTLNGLLGENAGAPDVQAEAATLYEDWGASEGAAGQQRLAIAISGRRAAPEVWGWNKLVQRLQREPAGKRTEALNQLLVNARAQLALAELEMSRVVQAGADKQRHLNVAKHAVFSFIRSTPGYSDEDYDRFNRLYATIQRESGLPVTALPRDPSLLVSSAADKAVASPPPAISPVEAIKSVAAAVPVKSGSALLVPLIIGVGLAAAGGMVFYWYRQQSEKRRRRLERRRTAGAAR